MVAFVLALTLTLGVSFLCSLMEAMVLSTTVIEIEGWKKQRPRLGARLEDLKLGLDETIATVLTVNTLANSIGSMVLGRIAAGLFSGWTFTIVSACIFMGILLLSEALPKNIGVIHRLSLQPVVTGPLWWCRRWLTPINLLCAAVVRFFIRRPPAEGGDAYEEILLMAERGVRQGTINTSEAKIIVNALSLEDVRVSTIMTPRTVMCALHRSATAGSVYLDFPAGLPFARIPVFGKSLDDIVGLVRRRDLLKAKAADHDNEAVERLMHEVHFIPETATAAHALQLFLKHHQQLLVAVDEFGSTAGVVTMEDVMEHILGREIFEKDDVAVDMRELARARMRSKAALKGKSGTLPGSTAVPWSTRPPSPPPAP